MINMSLTLCASHASCRLMRSVKNSRHVTKRGRVDTEVILRTTFRAWTNYDQRYFFLPLSTTMHMQEHVQSLFIGAFSSNVWNCNFKLSKNQLNHSILLYLCTERRTSRECVCLMAARHRYLFLRYALLNQTTLKMQNNRYVTWYTFTFSLIP